MNTHYPAFTNLFALVGFTCLIYGLYGSARSTWFLYRSDIVKGTVMKMERAPSGRTRVYNIIVEFKDKNGAFHLIKSDVPSFPPPANIGQEVLVAINRDTSKARIAMFSGLFLGNLIAIVAGTLFLVLTYGERTLSAILAHDTH